jgi:hypothetical protein
MRRYFFMRLVKALGAAGTFMMSAIAFTAIFLCSCDVPVDRGVFNPLGVPADQLVTVKIEPNLAISKVDNYQVFWTRPDNNYSQTVRMMPGIHTFEVSYNDGTTWMREPITIPVKFVTGNAYKISQLIQANSIEIQVNTEKDGVEESALFDRNSLSEADSPFAAYVKYVFYPTLNNRKSKVLISNDDMDILFEYDLIYRWTDKNTGKKTEGRYVIEMDSALGGRIYFVEVDINTVSSDTLLSGNFRQDAHIIAVPIYCDGQTAAYRYSKPEEAANREDVFVITNLTPVEEIVEIDEIVEVSE